MNLFKEDPLIGSWLSETIEEDGNLERVRLDFAKDGELVYTIICPEKIQKIFLIYWIKDGFLYTDQPSSPKEEKTAYILEQNGERLTLIYENDSPMHFTKLYYPRELGVRGSTR
ncbi:MAG: hypothetical protein K2X39_03525 [Silvanigrellaceae bacterium]|nr:hypothetical protein [Silvanigrellaceae bacterium]